MAEVPDEFHGLIEALCIVNLLFPLSCPVLNVGLIEALCIVNERFAIAMIERGWV